MFLPTLLSQKLIDARLKEVIETEEVQKAKAENPKKAVGLALKAFYSNVDKATVDGQLAKKRAEALLGLQ